MWTGNLSAKAHTLNFYNHRPRGDLVPDARIGKEIAYVDVKANLVCCAVASGPMHRKAGR